MYGVGKSKSSIKPPEIITELWRTVKYILLVSETAKARLPRNQKRQMALQEASEVC